jgi:hypothetical protein
MRSNSIPPPESQFVVLGARGDERVALFQQALARCGSPPARLVDYRDLFAEPETLSAALADAAYLRIESPGTEFEMWRAFALQALAGGDGGRGERFLRMIEPEHGRIYPPRLFFAGLCRAMALTKRRLRRSTALPLNDPDAIEVFFDKSECHRCLETAGLPVPTALAAPQSYDDLLESMRTARMHRVFVKVRYGSAASGVVAVEMSAHGVQAWSTTELVGRDGETRLYNSYRVRGYRGTHEVRPLIDALANHDLHLEQWIPKAGVAGRRCDVRLLMVAGRPAHAVLRLSRSPITNLHLRNERASVDLLRAKLPSATWDALIDVGARVARMFPRSFHIALDLAVHVNLRNVAILELNAFGDHLKRVSYEGLDTYELQLDRLPAWATTRRDAGQKGLVRHAAA